MLKAISTIIVGSKVFRTGQTVTGLSPIDKNWMKKAGYIAETVGREKSSGTEAVDADRKESDRNEL